ncbi:MAG: alpha/beta hydrolase [Gammaproteobacteria bacterium]|nr:alpha/beta hydrolase [Gammaproteobacteria bacterium]
MNLLKQIVLYFTIGYLLLLFVAYFFSNKMIFLPPAPSYKNTNSILKIHTSNGATIAAIYLPNKNAKYTLLVSHGNAEDLGMLMPFLRELQYHGFSVFAYDYQGYGLSSGSATEANSYQAADSAYNYLTQKLQIPPDHIIAYGFSLGAAMAIDLASRKTVAAVIAQSPFVSAFRTMTYIPLLPFDKFNNFSKIKQLKCPILIIHGTKDKIIPFWHSQKLYQTAAEPKKHLWIKGAGHNNLIAIAGTKYWQTLQQFTSNLEQ